MNELPSYYAIIPANVRYDKRLKANEKLLYAEITALSNKTGSCWASNGYLAELYGVSKVSISNWINNLVDFGYLESLIIYKKGTKEIEKRVLKISSSPMKENLKSPDKENFDRGIKENFKDNNTSINNTSINKEYIGQAEPTDAPKVPYKEIVDYLNQKVGTSFKSTARANQSIIKARFKEGYTLDDFKKVIDNKVDTWLNDSEMSKYLRPATLFGNKFDSYLNEKHKPLTAKEKDWGY